MSANNYLTIFHYFYTYSTYQLQMYYLLLVLCVIINVGNFFFESYQPNFCYDLFLVRCTIRFSTIRVLHYTTTIYYIKYTTGQMLIALNPTLIKYLFTRNPVTPLAATQNVLLYNDPQRTVKGIVNWYCIELSTFKNIISYDWIKIDQIDHENKKEAPWEIKKNPLT
jgi:hypothetical protein